MAWSRSMHPMPPPSMKPIFLAFFTAIPWFAHVCESLDLARCPFVGLIGRLLASQLTQ